MLLFPAKSLKNSVPNGISKNDDIISHATESTIKLKAWLRLISSSSFARKTSLLASVATLYTDRKTNRMMRSLICKLMKNYLATPQSNCIIRQHVIRITILRLLFY